MKIFQQNGQRKRPWKGKNAQQRKRKGNNNNAPRKQGPNGVVKAYRQRGNKNLRRKYTNCACCGHLPALACLGSECADGESRYDVGLVETPRSLPSGAPLNVAHLAITEAMKPGTWYVFVAVHVKEYAPVEPASSLFVDQQRRQLALRCRRRPHPRHVFANIDTSINMR